mgnify:CR=1 FL=1
MDRFWEDFHAEWGKACGEGGRSSSYNKEAWKRMQAELESLCQQFVAKDEVICGMREALAETLHAQHYEQRKNIIDKALSSPTCPHKEEAHRLKEDRDMWIKDDAKQNDIVGKLTAQLAQMREALKQIKDLSSSAQEYCHCPEIWQLTKVIINSSTWGSLDTKEQIRKDAQDDKLKKSI